MGIQPCRDAVWAWSLPRVSLSPLVAAAREGTLHIIREDSPDKYSVVETVKTEFGAKTMALDPKIHSLYLTTSDFGPAPPQRNSPTPSKSRPRERFTF